MMAGRAAMFLEGISEALATLRARPLRASLAALAMAAAVTTTAVVQTGLNALSRSAREASARAFGSDAFVVARLAAGTLSRRELALRNERNPNITRGDVRFVERVADGRVIYAATAQRGADISAGARTFENAAVNGAQASLFDIRDLGVEVGRPFTRAEDAAASQVVVAGRGIADELFPAGDPLGQAIRIAGRAFRIVGVLAAEGTAGSSPLDRSVWMPLAAFERAFGAPASLQVFAKAPEAAATQAAEDRARISMRARRHLQAGAADTFDIITPEASRTFVAAITGRLSAAGPPISFMALLAAIVVVANTTLVSVTQRTRDIGIRRALGASRANILVETLAESTLIACVGALVGLLGAIALLALASWAGGLDLPLEWPVLAASVAEAGLAGVAAGWYPARRAVRLEVINALRHE